MPVRPADWHLLRYQVSPDYYFDIILAFGGRSNPFLFCHLSNALHWIITDLTLVKSILHYIDDFLFITRADFTICQFVIDRIFTG